MRKLAVLAAGVVALAFATDTARAAYPGKNGLIGFSVECCSGSDLSDYNVRLVDPEGRRAPRLEDTGGVGVAFSPDGRRIAYGDAFGSGLRVQPADGSGRERRITRLEDYAPDWSPNGKRVAFTRLYQSDDYREELRIREGGASRRLTDGSDPAWSSKGTIAFVRDFGIHVIRPDGSGLRRVVERGTEPDWSPDGRRIVFMAGGRSSIWVVRADGRGARRLRCGSSPSFSPNGHKIVYIGCDGRLQIMGTAGKQARRVPGLRNIYYEEESLLQPDWQPLH